MEGGEEQDMKGDSHSFHAGFGEVAGEGAGVTRVRDNVHLCVPICGALIWSE